MDSKLLRAVYIFEFLLALVAFYTTWSHAGTQYHLDLMAWYWKLGLGLASAFAIVKATAAAVASERAWNVRTLRWLAVLTLLAALAGIVTYYYHTYEPSDEEEPETQACATAPAATRRRAFAPVSRSRGFPSLRSKAAPAAGHPPA